MLKPFRELLIIGTSIAIFSLIISAIAVTLSWKSYTNSKLNQRAEIFSTLRDRFSEIHGQLPKHILDTESPHIVERATDEWAIIERYWLLSYDEWFITNHIITYDKKALWLQFYRRVQQSSLRFPGMRMVLKDMLAGRISFGKKRDEYLKEIKDMERELQISDIQQLL
jgi:hypothetical protein